MRIKLSKLILIVAALALISWRPAVADDTRISGFEVFAGFACAPDITCGLLAAGWPQLDDTVQTWVGPSGSDGGIWTVIVNYQGDPGIVGESINSVEVISGNYKWHQSAVDGGGTLSGRILDGKVEWPESLGHSLSDANGIDCGPGVARFCLEISQGRNRRDVGRAAGCLDDTHPETVFPPHVWGELRVNDDVDCPIN